jgi:hypothetical protein
LMGQEVGVEEMGARKMGMGGVRCAPSSGEAEVSVDGTRGWGEKNAPEVNHGGTRMDADFWHRGCRECGGHRGGLQNGKILLGKRDMAGWSYEAAEGPRS